MDKNLIISELRKILNADLELAIIAAERTSKLKSEDDMKPEHKYDTRGIEAGYLSDGQKRRIEELKHSLKLVEGMPLQNFQKTDKIKVGALLLIQIQGSEKFYFLSTGGGGSLLKVDNKTIMVITPASPIGSSVMGLKCGDSFEMETQTGLREYIIKNIF